MRRFKSWTTAHSSTPFDVHVIIIFFAFIFIGIMREMEENIIILKRSSLHWIEYIIFIKIQCEYSICESISHQPTWRSCAEFFSTQISNTRSHSHTYALMSESICSCVPYRILVRFEHSSTEDRFFPAFCEIEYFISCNYYVPQIKCNFRFVCFFFFSICFAVKMASLEKLLSTDRDCDCDLLDYSFNSRVMDPATNQNIGINRDGRTSV